MCGSCSGGCCAGCKTMTAIVALLTTVTTVATLIGVYMTHVTPEGWMFGSLNGSVAVVAFLVSIMCWLKLVKKICPCGCKSACRDMCKGGDCKDSCCGGACSGCNHAPCTCK